MHTHSTNPTAKLLATHGDERVIWYGCHRVHCCIALQLHSSTSQLEHWEVQLDTRSHKSITGVSRLSRNSIVSQKMVKQSNGNHSIVKFQRLAYFNSLGFTCGNRLYLTFWNLAEWYETWWNSWRLVYEHRKKMWVYTVSLSGHTKLLG